MRKTALWCLLSAAVAFAAGLACPLPRRTTRPPAAAAAPPEYLDELGEAAAHFARRDDEIHRLDVPQAEKERLWQENRERRSAVMREVARRHGRE